MTEPLTITFGPPDGEKIAAEIRAIAKRLHIHESEAIGLIIGFGLRAMISSGLLDGRFTAPTSRTELLRSLTEMVAVSEEFDT